jgi:Lar family restriction alleviation protein
MPRPPFNSEGSTTLMPCPFCGGEAHLITGSGGSQFGKCRECGAEGARAWRREWVGAEDFTVVKQERALAAAQKWNRRANETALP